MSALGVAGAGTMGAGIAQLAALAGYETLLHDPQPAALEQGMERVRAGLRKGAERGRWSADEAAAAAERLRPAAALADLGPAELVIEAAPEDLELKRGLFDELARHCAADAVLATNTSSIPVTAIAAGVENPGRVVGMHFFNPPPLMPLLEVIPGLETEPAVVEAAREVGERFGKRVIVAADVPGFLVNRCGRPLYSESLRLLAERVAGVEQIDRVVRRGGFRMGPFELMDLVGIDVGFDVARSFHERSFGEPRWRPSPLQARMVASGNLGRKTGRGWYDYSDGAPARAEDPEPPAAGDCSGRAIAVLGEGAAAGRLRELAAERGFELREGGADVEASFLAADSGPVPAGPAALLCETRSLASWEAPAAVGFALPVGAATPHSELTRLDGGASDGGAEAVARVLADLGLRPEWVGDGPGLLLGRVLAQVVNEGAFALGEGIGNEEEIDQAAEFGLNYPHGPLAFGRLLGWERVRATLDGIWSERREERYRPAPKLLELAARERADA
jgi:3-hydroxybutyryl-CoA dehydrogenase